MFANTVNTFYYREMNIFIADRLSYAITSKREYTDEGFLRVPGRAARAGIQKYLASELGLTDREPNEVINVYRPPEEVFHPDSLASYEATDVTDNHPKDLVNSATFKDVSVGTVRAGARQDGDFVVVDVIIKDAKAIKAVESGKAQLSAGYMAEYDSSPGITPEGEPYEFIQRNIRINHVALVDKARAGAQARLFDSNPGVRTMKVVLDTGVQVEVADEATATLVTQTINTLKKRATDAEAEMTKAKEDAEKMEAEKDQMAEQLEEEKKKSSHAALAERVATIAKTTSDALTLAGKEFTCDSMDITTIKREALAKVRPAVNWGDKSAVYIQAAWDAALELGVTPTVNAQHAQLAKDGAAPVTDNKPAETPHSRATADKSVAWKKTAGEA